MEHLETHEFCWVGLKCMQQRRRLAMNKDNRKGKNCVLESHLKTAEVYDKTVVDAGLQWAVACHVCQDFG
jgi:hypothetical protein